MNVEIQIINKKRICLKNSFCIHNLTNICDNCNIKFGNTNKKCLFKSGNATKINNVINKIYN